MQAEFWHDKWESNQIGWHLNDVNPLIIDFFKELNLNKGAKVFVPLCGKSDDLVWLSNQGYEVIGIELSKIAVEDFFQTHNLQYEMCSDGTLNKYISGKITLYQGDFFELTEKQLGAISAVFDRASMIALPERMREEYCKHLSKLVGGAEILLICLEYDQSAMQGPPFSVSEEEVEKHYFSQYRIKKLETTDLLVESSQFKQQGLKNLDEKVYKISANP